MTGLNDTSERNCLSADLLCNHCGYNLRGLPTEGRCPECGTEVARSLRGDLLSAADPAWLERVNRGHLYVASGFLGFLVFAAAVPTVFGWVGLGLRLARGTGVSSMVLRVVNLVGIAGSLVLVLIGVVGITTLDPRLSLTEEPRALRRVVRGTAIAALLMAVSDCGLQLGSMAGRGVHPIILTVSSGMLSACSALTLVVASLYLVRLCERIPNPQLARKIRSGVRVFVYVVTITVAVNVLERVAGRLATPGGLTDSLLTPVVAAVATLLPLVCYVCAIVLMGRWLEHREAVKQCQLQPRHSRDDES